MAAYPKESSMIEISKTARAIIARTVDEIKMIRQIFPRRCLEFRLD
jgi:hypothetical protein